MGGRLALGGGSEQRQHRNPDVGKEDVHNGSNVDTGDRRAARGRAHDTSARQRRSELGSADGDESHFRPFSADDLDSARNGSNGHAMNGKGTR